jgi:hypothetical protein
MNSFSENLLSLPNEIITMILINSGQITFSALKGTCKKMQIRLTQISLDKYINKIYHQYDKNTGTLKVITYLNNIMDGSFYEYKSEDCSYICQSHGYYLLGKRHGWWKINNKFYYYINDEVT